MAISEKIQALVPEITDWRHELHSRPETAFEEVWTSDFVAGKLDSFGLEVERGIGKTGVVGTLRKGQSDGGAVGLRADMDALNMQEKNDLEYKSRFEGKMHACGHDGHTATLLGAAKLLSQSNAFKGTVHFIFQPAEENEGGGQKMVEDGLFEKYPVKSAFSMHNAPMLPKGTIATAKGALMAAFDVFEIFIKGKGGHAAMPQFTRDPILASSNMITQFQSIVSRNLDPISTAVLSVTEIHGGTSFNIIPNDVYLRGTTRHFQPEVQDMVESRMKSIVRGVAESIDVKAEIKYDRRYPALINTDKETEDAIKAAIAVCGSDKVVKDMPPIMGSEDFAFMLKAVPGNYVFIGSGVDGPEQMPHQCRYDFSDEIIPIGVAYWEELVNNLLPYS